MTDSSTPCSRKPPERRRFIAGLLAGTINTVVGSGTLITFPTLLFFGYAPVAANVSNTWGLVAAAITGAWESVVAGAGVRWHSAHLSQSRPERAPHQSQARCRRRRSAYFLAAKSVRSLSGWGCSIPLTPLPGFWSAWRWLNAPIVEAIVDG